LKDVYIDTIDRHTFGGNCDDVPIVRALRDAQLDGAALRLRSGGYFPRSVCRSVSHLARRKSTPTMTALTRAMPGLKGVRCDLGADPDPAFGHNVTNKTGMAVTVVMRFSRTEIAR